MIGAWRRDREPRSGIAAAAVTLATVSVGVGFILVAVAMPASAALSTGPRAGAVIDAGAVVRLSDPGVELTVPVDGRLRGDGVALVVTGAALSDQAGTGDETVTAGPGRHLIVFALRQVPQPDTPTPPPAALVLVTPGERRTIDLTSLPDDGPWNFAAAVPATAAAGDVHLELTAAGFTQRFNLMTLTRPGPDPVALYRDVDNPAVVDHDNSGVAVAVTTGPPDSTTYQLMVGAATTTVAWFAPDPSIHTPPAADRAFLSVQLAVTPDPAINRSRYLQLPSPVPATHVHILLGDGSRLDATHFEADTTSVSGVDTLFSGLYYFTVPADVAAGTIEVDAYGGNGFAGGFFADPAAVTIAAFTIPLALTAPPPALPPATARTVLKLTHPTSSAAATGTPGAAHSTGSSDSGTVLIAAALVVCAGGAALVVARRRRPPKRIGAAPTWPAPPPGSTDRVQPQPTVLPDPLSWSNQPDRPPSPVRHDTASHTPTNRPASAERTRSDVGAGPAPTAPAPTLAIPVLAAIPTASAPPAPGILYFEVLGPLRITGWPDDALRPVPVIDLATYLALHPEKPHTADELRDPLSIGKPRALEADTIRTYAGNLRRIVGADHLPDAARRGYTLTAATTDWHTFQHLTTTTPGTEPAQQAARLAAALNLVRGAPFSDLPATGFGWVATELLVSHVETAVIAAALQLAGLADAAGDWRLAAWAAERGLIVSPTAHELNAATLQAAARSGHPDRLAQAWRDVTRRHHAAEEPVPQQLTQLHQQTRQQAQSTPPS